MAIVLNEERIRRIVEESLLPVLLEAIDLRPTMGSKGHLGDGDLMSVEEAMTSTYELYDKVMSTGKMVNIDRVFADDPGYNIWKNYVASMLGSFEQEDVLDKRGNPVTDTDGSVIKKPILKGFKPQDKEKKYPKSARAFFGWLHDIRTGRISKINGDGKYPIKVFKSGDNYLFGHYIHGVFLAAYISMATPRGLFSLLTELAQYDNVVLMITLDMAPSLEKLGFYTDGEVHQAKFHGKMVEKKTFATSEKALFIANTAQKFMDLL